MQTFQLATVPGEHPLDKAARLVGGRSTLAEKLGVSPAAIGNWKTRGVPIENCYPIEKTTYGAVTRRDLRPDWQDIWPELAHPTAIPVDNVKVHDVNHEAAAPAGLAISQVAGQGA